MRLLLDTHTFLFAINPFEELPTRVRVLLEDSAVERFVSVISIWEIAVKVSLGKLEIDRDVRAWVADAGAYPGVTIHPLSADDAVESTLLPGRSRPSALVTSMSS